MPESGSGNAPGPTDFTLAQAARAKSVRLLAALIFLRRMVNEIIVAFLGTLHLDQHPESKPFTPFGARRRASAQDNAPSDRVHPPPRRAAGDQRLRPSRRSANVRDWLFPPSSSGSPCRRAGIATVASVNSSEPGISGARCVGSAPPLGEPSGRGGRSDAEGGGPGCWNGTGEDRGAPASRRGSGGASGGGATGGAGVDGGSDRRALGMTGPPRGSVRCASGGGPPCSASARCRSPPPLVGGTGGGASSGRACRFGSAPSAPGRSATRGRTTGSTWVGSACSPGPGRGSCTGNRVVRAAESRSSGRRDGERPTGEMVVTSSPASGRATGAGPAAGAGSARPGG
jgi:hypothetical protein